MKKIIFLLFLISKVSFASFDMNENMQKAYLSVIDLNFEKGQSFIALEKQQNPTNGLIYINENYQDFLELIIGEDKQLFEKLSKNKNKRLSAIEKCDKTSPYYLYAKAEINLQWAFARLKFQEYFLAAYEIQKAYFILEENQEKFPDFHLNKKGAGLLHCLIGSIPENYQWIVNSIGISGGITQGIAELHELLLLTEQDENYKIYNTELLFLISFLEMNLTIEQSNFQKTLDAIGEKHNQHILLTFAAARLSYQLGENEYCLQVLENRNTKKNSYPFYYLDYLQGMSYLYKLDFQNAEIYFSKFISEFKGENYIKSTYQKLAWIAFLQNNTQKQTTYLQKVLENGNTFLDEDKQALKQAEKGKISPPILLKSRLFYDGGYYQKAHKEILLSDKKNMEFYYRLARIESKLNMESKEIITHYQKAFELGKNTTNYFAPMSALQIAIEYEKMGEKQKAKSYYNKCLSMKGFDYERGIHQKAKAGLQRTAN